MPSIKYKKKTYAGATFPVLEMTKAEYDALPEAKKMDGTVYMITDDTGGWEAENASYDNTSSGLTATNVQDALDEIVSTLETQKTATYSAFMFRRFGHTVYVRALGAKLNPTTQWVSVGTVSQEFRPPNEVIGLVSWGGNMGANGGVKITTAGELLVYASSAQSAAGCWTCFSYYVD